MNERDRHCIVERRICRLYKDRLGAIVGFISKNCRDSDLVNDVKEAMEHLRHDLDNMPSVPVPDGLVGRL
jgi:hypothetical protein